MPYLAYHKITSKSKFENQVSFLISKYNFPPPSHFIGEKDMVLTFDDGDPSFYSNAFPVLLKYKIPAILFVITNLINTRLPFWWDEIEYYLGEEVGNKKVWEVKNWSNERREMYLDDLRNNSDKPRLQKKQLTVEQLKEMQEGGVMIANHSHTHPMFDQCTPAEIAAEMVKSKKVLNELGFTPEVFAYPNGNFSPETEMALKKFEVKKAFLFDHKISKSNNFHPLRISRLIVNDSIPMWKFRLILSGWHSRILPLTRAIGKLRY